MKPRDARGIGSICKVSTAPYEAAMHHEERTECKASSLKFKINLICALSRVIYLPRNKTTANIKVLTCRKIEEFGRKRRKKQGDKKK